MSTLKERLLAKTVIVEGPLDTPCWIFTGAKHEQGYGQIHDNDYCTTIKAHRASWQVYFGSIPNDLQVLHHCDNRACINPEHLWLGTHQDNMDDMVQKNRQANQYSGLPKPGPKEVYSLGMVLSLPPKLGK